jgi:hypothetical protein
VVVIACFNSTSNLRSYEHGCVCSRVFAAYNGQVFIERLKKLQQGLAGEIQWAEYCLCSWTSRMKVEAILAI